MIPSREIREKARECGVPETTVERDYAQNWLLKHLPPKTMILKGGTGIRKIYIANYRFSDDCVPRSCTRDEGLAPRSLLAGAGFKPP